MTTHIQTDYKRQIRAWRKARKQSRRRFEDLRERLDDISDNLIEWTTTDTSHLITVAATTDDLNPKEDEKTSPV